MPRVEPFEKYADRYEEWFKKHKPVYESELLAIKELLPAGGIGIEIGVGSGHFAAPLGIKYGIEPSPNMARMAQKRGIEVVDGVAESIPFGDSRFDFALMVTTICFLDDIEAAFRETYRVLKPGGFFITGFVDVSSPIGRLYQQHKNENVFYREATFYSVDSVVFHLKKSGFRDFSFRQTLFRPLAETCSEAVPRRRGSAGNIEPVKPGYGEGSFVAVKAAK